MAVNIDTVYQKVLAIANKEQRGYITPQEFNLYANLAQQEIFEQYFYDLNQQARIPGNEYIHSDVDDILEARKDLNSREELFLHYWIKERMTPQQAYLKAFPTNNPGYASMKAGQLIKTERVDTRMKEDLKPILKELKINDKLVLSNIKALATDGSKEDTRLKALFKLSDILDLEDKTRTSVQQISGAVFQGFSEEQLDVAKRKEITDGE